MSNIKLEIPRYHYCTDCMFLQRHHFIHEDDDYCVLFNETIYKEYKCDKCPKYNCD